MPCDEREVRVLMEKRNVMPDGDESDQAVNRTADGNSRFSQAAINVRGLYVIGEIDIQPVEKKEVVFNGLIQRVISYSLEDFLSDDPRHENTIALADAVPQKGSLAGRHTAEKIDPNRGVNQYPQLSPSSSLLGHPPI